MRRKQVKTIIVYYSGIPGMVKLLERERLELEDEYNGLRGTSLDGMPHSHMPGKPTEELALRMETKNTWARIQEIDVKEQVLHMDAAIIRDCLDALNGKYKSLVRMKYLDGYSWAKISVSLGAPDGTIRRWNDRALERLGEVLDDAPMVGEILGRASRARLEVSAGIFRRMRRAGFGVRWRRFWGVSRSGTGPGRWTRTPGFCQSQLRATQGISKGSLKPLEKQFANRQEKSPQGAVLAALCGLCSVRRINPRLNA